MFNNIGRKIKGLAKFIFWVISIISIVGGAIIAFSTITNSNAESSQKIASIIIGILTAVGGVILAWLQNFLLYGFGELIDTNQKMLAIMEQNNIGQQ